MAKYRLTANKTKFYNLAKTIYPDIGPMRGTEFIKYFRVPDFALLFQIGEQRHRLFLSICAGRPTLLDECYTCDDDGERKRSWGRTLDIEQLRVAGMLEEVAG